jgi:hypothetical protein
LTITPILRSRASGRMRCSTSRSSALYEICTKSIGCDAMIFSISACRRPSEVVMPT